VLKQLRDRLRATRTWAQASLAAAQPASAAVLVDNRDLLDPLELCFQSLHECGMGVIADGPLLDCLRRAVTFGLFLVRLDVRQDAARHRDALTDHRLPGPRALRRLGRRAASVPPGGAEEPSPVAAGHFKPRPTPPKCLPPAAKSPPRRLPRWVPM
jgi:hypothetical protein